MDDFPLPLPVAHFDFLGLPADIRLMVYERLPTRVVHDEVAIKTHGKTRTLSVKDTKVKLVTIWHPTTIRLTCRLIREEATVIIARTTAISNRKWLAEDQLEASRSFFDTMGCKRESRLCPKIIVSICGLNAIAHEAGPIDAALEYLSWAIDARKTGSGCVTATLSDPSSPPDSSAIAHWARQAGWRLAQMHPHDRTIYVVIDSTPPDPSSSWPKSLHPSWSWRPSSCFDTDLLRCFQEDVAKLWQSRKRQLGYMVIGLCMKQPSGEDLIDAGHYDHEFWTFPRFATGLDFDDVILEKGEWNKTWAPQDWL